MYKKYFNETNAERIGEIIHKINSEKKIINDLQELLKNKVQEQKEAFQNFIYKSMTQTDVIVNGAKTQTIAYEINLIENLIKNEEDVLEKEKYYLDCVYAEIQSNKEKIENESTLPQPHNTDMFIS